MVTVSSVTQPIILYAYTLKGLVQYVSLGKAYKKEKVFCMYIGPFILMLVDLFLENGFLFSL